MIVDNPFEHRPKITRDLILSKIPQEDIFKEFLGIAPEYDVSFCNPLRSGDTHPGCRFYIDSRGMIKFKDWAGGFSWDCFNVVEYSERTDFRGALKLIAERFSIVSSGSESISHISPVTEYAPKKRSYEIRIQRRKWVKADLEWWGQYFIDEERLYRFKVSPIEQAWFLEDGALRSFYNYHSNDPCYAYKLVGMYDYKLYFPFRKKKDVRRPRFIQSPINTFQGIELLPPFGDNLLITKSYKDVICISIFEEDFGLYSTAPLSETILMEEEVFGDLYNRFDFLATLFDFDKTGIRLMRKYEDRYKLPFCMFGNEYKREGIKDFSDHLKIKGIDKTKTLIDYAIKRLRVTT